MKQKTIYTLLSVLVSVVLNAQEVRENTAFGYVSETHGVFGRSPEFDVVKALYGVMPGLSVSQGTGSNAENWSSLGIHGHKPLVLIDGFPRSLSEITASEIESVTVLNDATAAAIYGVKGANGVVSIRTKRGDVTPLKVSAQYTYGLSTPFRMPEFADAYTYAMYWNEALTLDGLSPKYNSYELKAFRTGEYPSYYPDVDWQKEVYNDVASNHRMSMTFNGGSKKFRYYSVVDYMHDMSLYRNQHTDDRYDANHYNTNLGLRTNVDIDLTGSTFLKLGVMARMSQKNRSHSTGIDEMAYTTPSAAFPVYAENGNYGGTAVWNDRNPVAWINDKGSYTTSTVTVLADMNLRQDFSSLVKGLSAEASVSFDYIGGTVDTISKEYMYSDSAPTLLSDGSLILNPVNYGKNSQTLEHDSWLGSVTMRSELSGQVNYVLDTDGHGLDAHLVYRQRAYVLSGRNNSSKTQEVMLTANYSWKGRYFINAVGNYSGTSYLKKGERFRFYPAVSVAWNITNEDFFRNVKAVNLFKIFASAGKSGNDGNLSHELHLQTYGDANAGEYYFTTNAAASWGQAEGNLPAEGLTPEISLLYNAGIDLRMFDNRLSLYATAFMENRSGILVDPSNVSGIIGIGVGPQSIGEQEYWGSDFSISWKERIGKFSYGVFGTGGYLNSRIIEDGQVRQAYDYLYHKGDRVGQCYGLEVIGIFQNYYQIDTKPKQEFTTVRPGDLMYKDQNRDGVINDEDVVKMFGSTIPRFNFGFGFELGYGDFEMSATFQGRTGVTVNLLSSPLYKPMTGNTTISMTFLENEVPWSPERAWEATMPRLTTMENANNYRNSSIWYRDGSFIKLRNLTFAYTLPKRLVRFSDMKIYIQGTNLLSLDNIKFADPEQLAADYPSTCSFWLGVKFNF